MDDQEFFTSLVLKLKKYFPYLLAFGGLILIGYGLIQYQNSKQPQSDIVFQAASDVKETKAPENKLITIDIEGSVIKPGVYSVAENSRMQEALVVAGGMSSTADRKWVAKNINLALKLKDGEKIYIPSLNEVLTNSAVLSANTSSSTISDLININSASLDQLDTLSGIGPVTAQKIVDGRPYSAIEDLVSNKIVTQKVFDKIKEKIIAQ